MESIVYEDSPLADYLEGRGEALAIDTELSPDTDPAAPSDRLDPSFAPSTASTAYARYRKQIPSALRIHVRSTSASISRFQHACTGAVRGQLGHGENAAFLDRFRYNIIASDLLSEHHQGYPKQGDVAAAADPVGDKVVRPVFSANGVVGIAVAAFVLVASIAWARSYSGRSNLLQIFMFVLFASTGGAASYSFVRRKWLQYLRAQAADYLNTLVSNARAFDAALSATVTIIQEVELVARGYRISTPLAPISRMDEQGQQRRCARLRTAARTAVHNLLRPLAQAASKLDKLAVQADLERYHDIYEITRTNVDEIEQLAHGGIIDEDDGESLKTLKQGLQQLFLARKLLLCDLLALDADGTQTDTPRWTIVVQALQDLSLRYGHSALALDELLSDEERFAVPPTPKLPMSPSREKARAQIRKLGGLSSGIRGLQAKMHVLREEADRHLDGAEDTGDLGATLMSQYDAIGLDLKALLQEWEEGKATLSQSNNKRLSMSSAGLLSPRAQTPTSWGGTTAIGGSPSDALRALNGETLSPRLDATSSDEEVFEAIAMPRQRTTNALSREERIAKMKEDRSQRERARESSQASTNMLRELETVLKYKPQASKAARRVTVM